MSTTVKRPKQPSTAIIRLDLKKWRDDLINYATARINKKNLAAELAAAESTVKAIRGKLLEAMNDATVAQCGNAILTVRTTSAAEATLTLADGTKLPWARVTSVLVGNTVIPRTDVLSLYGGRSSSLDVDISGTP